MRCACSRWRDGSARLSARSAPGLPPRARNAATGNGDWIIRPLAVEAGTLKPGRTRRISFTGPCIQIPPSTVPDR